MFGRAHARHGQTDGKAMSIVERYDVTIDYKLREK